MNCELCKLFLSLLSPELQRTFKEEMMSNPDMKIKDMCDHFWNTYKRVTGEEAKENKDMLTAAWQPYQGFEALIAQIRHALYTATLLKWSSQTRRSLMYPSSLSSSRDTTKPDTTGGNFQRKSTTNLGQHNILLEEGIPPSQSFDNRTPSRVWCEGSRRAGSQRHTIQRICRAVCTGTYISPR